MTGSLLNISLVVLTLKSSLIACGAIFFQKQGKQERSISEDVTETRLIERAQSGDMNALGELFQSNKNQLLYIAKDLLEDQDEAEDAVQIAFIKAIRAIERGQYRKINSTTFKSWLIKIVKNCASDIRKRRRRDALLVPLEEEIVVPTQANHEEQVDKGFNASPLDIQSILTSLEYLVICHRVIDELTHKEIAARIPISEAYSKVIQNRALKKLRAKSGAPKAAQAQKNRHKSKSETKETENV